MKITLMAVGRMQNRLLREATEEYLGRAVHYMPVEMVEIADVRMSRATDSERQKQLEGERILAALQPSDRVVLLDERGAEMTSRQLAASISSAAVGGLKRLVYIIGGPYGFSADVYARANAKLSMSRMTFTHEMARLFFAEQIYRAMTILRGEPYHHD